MAATSHPVPHRPLTGPGLLVYLVIGVYFGTVITKGEVVSWFRIQEMFRFQSFHMYGVLMSAVVVAAVAIALIKAGRLHTLGGDPIAIAPKQLGAGHRYWIGGLLFGAGWALTGACPGPTLALIGAGLPAYLLVLASALAGTWAYGALRSKLPH